MITAGNPHDSDRAAAVGRVRTMPASDPLPIPTRSVLATCTDVLCCVLTVVAAGAAAMPVLWGLALHQPPLAISGGCGVAMCLIALFNRLLAPPAARQRAVPFLAALEERHAVLLTCMALGGTALLVLLTWWPG